MNLEIQLDEKEIAKLKTLADGQGVSTESLVRRIIVDVLSESGDLEFDQIIERVIGRNAELYRRLA